MYSERDGTQFYGCQRSGGDILISPKAIPSLPQDTQSDTLQGSVLRQLKPKPTHRCLHNWMAQLSMVSWRTTGSSVTCLWARVYTVPGASWLMPARPASIWETETAFLSPRPSLARYYVWGQATWNTDLKNHDQHSHPQHWSPTTQENFLVMIPGARK